MHYKCRSALVHNACAKAMFASSAIVAKATPNRQEMMRLMCTRVCARFGCFACPINRGEDSMQNHGRAFEKLACFSHQTLRYDILNVLKPCSV